MPQYPFVQLMAISGFVAIVITGLSIPLGARLGARAGTVLVRIGLAGTVAAITVGLAWGMLNGDLAAFRMRAEPGALVQMGVFFLIMYSAAYRFASAYLRDKAEEAPDA